jgi:serine/threonine protein kinase
LGACWPCYPTPNELGLPDHIKTIKRSDLLEIERLGPSIDLVSFKTESGQVERAVFRYFFARQDVHRHLREQQALFHIGNHPNLIEYQRAVLDDSGQVVVGFLTEYMPTGKLLRWLSGPFKLSHLEQLLQAVDDINLEFGLAHGDIGLDRVLIDEPTDRLKLIDMGLVRPRTAARALVDIHMTVSTVYQLITGGADYYSQEGVWEETSAFVHHLETLPSWELDPKLQLDHGVTIYRSLLQGWAAERLAILAPDVDRSRKRKLPHPENKAQRDENANNRSGAKRIRLKCETTILKFRDSDASNARYPLLLKTDGTSIDLPAAPRQFVPRPIIKQIMLSNGECQVTDLFKMEEWPDRSDEARDPQDPIVQWTRPSEAQREPGVQYLANGQRADETVKVLVPPSSPEEYDWDSVGEVVGSEVDDGDAPTTPVSTTTAAALSVAAATAATARAEAATGAVHAAIKMALDAANAANAAARAAQAASDSAVRAAQAVEAASLVAEGIVRRGGNYLARRDSD